MNAMTIIYHSINKGRIFSLEKKLCKDNIRQTCAINPSSSDPDGNLAVHSTAATTLWRQCRNLQDLFDENDEEIQRRFEERHGHNDISSVSKKTT